MHGSINSQNFVALDAMELNNHLSPVHSTQWNEINLVQDGDAAGQAALYILTNGNRALLVYFRYEGDTGFSSRNPTHVESQDAMLDFRLSNGQVDQYPTSWTVSIQDALRAAQHFFFHGEPAPWIVWHDDS
jgi:hypothetical protein